MLNTKTVHLIEQFSILFVQVKNQNPELKFVEIGKIIGGMWRKMSEEERSEYTEEYETEKVDYERKMAQYKNTPAFQVSQEHKTHHESSYNTKLFRVFFTLNK